jgi:hypothetical protein
LSDISRYLSSYNENTYLNLILRLNEELPKIENFLISFQTTRDFSQIDTLVDHFELLFNSNDLFRHIDYKLQKIYKSLYLTNPGPFTKGNSYFHLTLKLKSDEIIWIDQIYDFRLTNLIKLFRHLFSRIDNYFIDFNSKQLSKYLVLVKSAGEDIKKFIAYNDHRDVISKRRKLDEKHLKRLPFGGLFYIAHLSNIDKILNLGILSHTKAHQSGLVSVDISNQSVNSLRNRDEPILNHKIHEYAPLYINPKNPMLYKLCSSGLRNELVLLKINPHILLNEEVLFSDGNAASRATKFFKNIDDFNLLNWECINDTYWTNYLDGKRFRCSEVLVYEEIPLYYINEINTFSPSTLEKILPMFPNHLGILSQINPKLYF